MCESELMPMSQNTGEELDQVEIVHFGLQIFTNNKIIIEDQDRRLENVLGTIKNLKGQTLMIGSELDEQAT